MKNESREFKKKNNLEEKNMPSLMNNLRDPDKNLDLRY